MGNETESKAAPKYQLIVFVAAFSAFLATFNETFLNVSFAFVMKDFGVSVGTVQWLATAYMLGAAVMVPGFLLFSTGASKQDRSICLLLACSSLAASSARCRRILRFC